VSQPDPLAETPAQRDARMAWWREARFGMFIHWGIYAVPAGVYHGRIVDPHHGSEWIQCDAPIPAREYARYAGQFNPAAYDPQAWARLAADAGMRYLVITAKHHDGFCMFPTAATDYHIAAATPFASDPLAPLAAACRAEGVRFGLYYSQLDWHHPAQMLHPEREGKLAYRFNAVRPGMKPHYVAYMKAQLRELIERYRPAVLFFDGEWADWWTRDDGRDLARCLRSLDPALVINNRVGKRTPDDGDYGTPEQHIPDTGLGIDWETCMTLNGTWGYKSYDHDWKSAADLIHKLIDIASKGGNFLLNVGPTAEGIIPEPSAERLRAMGAWLKANGEAIYGTTASPLPAPPWGRCTARPGRLYLHVLDWPSVPLSLDGIPNPVAAARLLADGRPLQIAQTDGTISIELPREPPDPVATVVALDVEGELTPQSIDAHARQQAERQARHIRFGD